MSQTGVILLGKCYKYESGNLLIAYIVSVLFSSEMKNSIEKSVELKPFCHKSISIDKIYEVFDHPPCSVVHVT